MGKADGKSILEGIYKLCMWLAVFVEI